MNISIEIAGKNEKVVDEYSLIKYGVSVQKLNELTPFIKEMYISKRSNRIIKKVSVIEVYKFEPWLKGGELALTTLASFPTVKMQVTILEQLIAGGAACLAFHPGTQDQANNQSEFKIHEEALRLAKQKDFPIILLRPDATYAEIIEAIFKIDLRQQNKHIDRLEKAHEKLFHYLSNNINLEKTFRDIGLVTSKKIILFDINLDPLISSQSMTECDVINQFQKRDVKDFLNKDHVLQLFLNRNKVFLNIKNERVDNYLIAPVFKGEYLEYILLIENKTDQLDFHFKLIDAIVSAISMEQHSKLDQHLSLFQKACDQLFANDNEEAANTIFQQLNLSTDNAHSLVIMKVMPSKDDNEIYIKNMKLRIKRLFNSYLEHESFSGWYDNLFIVFICEKSAEQQRKFALKLNKIMEQSFSSIKYKVGIDSSLTERNLLRSYQEINHALSYGQTNNQPILSFDDTGLSKLFINMKDETYIKHYFQTNLQPILSLESPRQEELLKTLKVFIEKNLNFKDTAKSLYIHPNTVRYRIQQIKDIYKDKDLLSNPDRRFDLLLSMKLREMLKQNK